MSLRLSKCSDYLAGLKSITPAMSQTGFKRESSPVEPATPSGPLSVLLIISAKALSSVGFGMSVLAIWLRWMLPDAMLLNIAQASTSEVSRVTIPQKAPKVRSSARSSSKPHPNPPTPIRRKSAPVTVNPVPILDNHREMHPSQPSHRRVYFADTKQPLLRRNTSPAENPRVLADETPSPPPANVLTPVITESPLSSPVSLTTSYATSTTHDAAATIDTEPEPDTDKASIGSSTPRTRKLRLSFTLKHKRPSDKSRDSLDGATQGQLHHPSCVPDCSSLYRIYYKTKETPHPRPRCLVQHKKKQFNASHHHHYNCS
ncbi:hypothetical protein FA15DRAFT_262486 [Coprinopsis marcescibilis]|uniref:Uncharacterized protein n=1 Tax=Coprinopsis marcescibilis TaxID=230819 RepID=A0A5C3L1F6_COPMA|nr:hypothetical protein FA15DRAFT_262486 [Coprinopsis marcescibilis]